MAAATEDGLNAPGYLRIVGLQVKWVNANDHTVQMLEG